MQGSFMNVNVF